MHFKGVLYTSYTSSELQVRIKLEMAPIYPFRRHVFALVHFSVLPHLRRSASATSNSLQA